MSTYLRLSPVVLPVQEPLGVVSVRRTLHPGVGNYVVLITLKISGGNTPKGIISISGPGRSILMLDVLFNDVRIGATSLAWLACA